MTAPRASRPSPRKSPSNALNASFSALNALNASFSALGESGATVLDLLYRLAGP